MSVKIFNGVISDGEDSQFIIGDEIVAEEIENADFGGKEVHLRYTISKNPIDPESVEEDTYKTLMGVLDAEHGRVPFSEWTGFVAWDDTLRVGGHDLIEELLRYEGQYCYLELWQSESVLIK